MDWHGYILIEKPPALTMAQWRDVLLALYRVLDNRADDPQPCNRLHYRLSLDKTKVLIETAFDDADLDIEDLSRLPRYISNALDGVYTPAQCRDALRNYITIATGGWDASRRKVLAYLKANAAEWEPAEESPRVLPKLRETRVQLDEAIPTVFGIPLCSRWTWGRIISPILRKLRGKK